MSQSNINTTQTGTERDDTLLGTEGDDSITGNMGDDFGVGGSGEDRLIGNGSDDAPADGAAAQSFMIAGHGASHVSGATVADGGYEAGSSFVYSNIGTDADGNPIDLLLEIVDTSNGSPMVWNSGSLSALNVRGTEDTHFTYRMTVIEGGSATAENPSGVPTEVHNAVLVIGDIDSSAGHENYSDIEGYSTAYGSQPTSVEMNGTQEGSFMNGANPGDEFTMYTMADADGSGDFKGEGNNTTDSSQNSIRLTYDSFSSGLFVHGGTGTEGGPFSRHVDFKFESFQATPGTTDHDRMHGQDGADYLEGNHDNDLLAGGDSGEEWSLVDGQWVYDQSKQVDGEVTDTHGDELKGGVGDDVLLGGKGDDTLHGDEGNDTLNAGEDNDIAYGGAGDDQINLEDGDDYGSGGDGDDVIHAGAGDDTVEGGAGADTITGGEGRDTIYGNDGADTIYGGTGNDTVVGGEGADTLFGEAGNDTIEAGGGDDQVYGGEGNDSITGGGGNDELYGEAGNDAIYAGSGDDRVDGGAGNDHLEGQTGDDFVTGGSGSDTVKGGDGDDKLVGGADGDRIVGGAGNDHMWGGEWTGDDASDIFVFSPGSGQDMVHDFETGNDVIDLSAYGLSWDDLQPAIQDHGWAVSIELGAVGGEAGDRIFLTNVSSEDLSADNFDFGG